MKKYIIVLLLFVAIDPGFTQNLWDISDTIRLSDLGTDSVYVKYLKLKDQQEQLSDCEFGKKIAKKDFDKKDYIYYSVELVGPCLYCDVLRLDYNIQWQFSSHLFSNDYFFCYNKEMVKLLNQKYGFDIFQRAKDKVDSLHKINSPHTSYLSDAYIPFLIDNRDRKRIYIQDSCIEDTLRIRYRVEVTFEHSLIDTIKPMVVKSVNLIDMDIRSLNSSHIIASLSKLTPIESPLQQYIWNLCSAKVAYWYRFQPYNELPRGERIREGNTIYMGATIWLVPE